ncbi:hypothetical protein D3C79_967800 [compost metagenome]
MAPSIPNTLFRGRINDFSTHFMLIVIEPQNCGVVIVRREDLGITKFTVIGRAVEATRILGRECCVPGGVSGVYLI